MTQTTMANIAQYDASKPAAASSIEAGDRVMRKGRMFYVTGTGGGVNGEMLSLIALDNGNEAMLKKSEIEVHIVGRKPWKK